MILDKVRKMKCRQAKKVHKRLEEGCKYREITLLRYLRAHKCYLRSLREYAPGYKNKNWRNEREEL